MPELAVAATTRGRARFILPRGRYRTSMRLLLAWLACVPVDSASTRQFAPCLCYDV